MAAMLPARVYIIDDHALFRSGLRMVLGAAMAGLDMAEAASLEDAMRDDGPQPAVVLMDVQLRGLNGIDGLALVDRKWPGARVVVLSSDASPLTVRRALDGGASAFVPKADAPDKIISVVERLVRGGELDAGTHPPAADPDPAAAGPKLTPRQFEVLDLICQGLSNKLIGRRLNLSENTVRAHVQATLAVLEVSSRSEAAFAARQRGLVSG